MMPDRSDRPEPAASAQHPTAADPIGGGWPDLSGRLSGDGHVLPIRVYFEDTDFSGIVYHASYIRWCERGRSDYLRLLGVHHDQLIAGRGGVSEPAAFVVRRLEIDYLKPARIDEVLEIRTRPGHITAATLNLLQSVWRGETPLFRAQVMVVLVATSGRVLRVPAGLRGRLGMPP